MVYQVNACVNVFFFCYTHAQGRTGLLLDLVLDLQMLILLFVRFFLIFNITI